MTEPRPPANRTSSLPSGCRSYQVGPRVEPCRVEDLGPEGVGVVAEPGLANVDQVVVDGGLRHPAEAERQHRQQNRLTHREPSSAPGSTPPNIQGPPPREIIAITTRGEDYIQRLRRPASNRETARPELSRPSGHRIGSSGTDRRPPMEIHRIEAVPRLLRQGPPAHPAGRPLYPRGPARVELPGGQVDLRRPACATSARSSATCSPRTSRATRAAIQERPRAGRRLPAGVRLPRADPPRVDGDLRPPEPRRPGRQVGHPGRHPDHHLEVAALDGRARGPP